MCQNATINNKSRRPGLVPAVGNPGLDPAPLFIISNFISFKMYNNLQIIKAVREPTLVEVDHFGTAMGLPVVAEVEPGELDSEARQAGGDAGEGVVGEIEALQTREVALAGGGDVFSRGG